jgi:hypothetical protein
MIFRRFTSALLFSTARLVVSVCLSANPIEVGFSQSQSKQACESLELPRSFMRCARLLLRLPSRRRSPRCDPLLGEAIVVGNHDKSDPFYPIHLQHEVEGPRYQIGGRDSRSATTTLERVLSGSVVVVVVCGGSGNLSSAKPSAGVRQRTQANRFAECGRLAAVLTCHESFSSPSNDLLPRKESDPSG